MARVVRSVANAMILLGILGCDDFLGIGGDLDVDVTAEVKRDENLIGFTVENRSSETIYLHQTRGWLEVREGGEWQQVGAGVPTIDILFPPIAIGPEEDYTEESQIELEDGRRLPPGEYRYNLVLRDEDDELLPDEKRISNVVQVE